jgi:hypothetical protein
MTAFWDVAQRNLVEIDGCFRGAYCLYHHGVDRRFGCVYCMHRQGDERSSMHPCKVIVFLPDYTALHPRRQTSLYSLSWEHEISSSECPFNVQSASRHCGGPFAVLQCTVHRELPTDLLDTKHTHSPYLTIGSWTGDPLLTNMPRAFQKYFSDMAEFSRDTRYFDPNVDFQLI